MTPEKATMEPSDRSMPPVRITYVTPMPRMEFIEIWRSTLVMFLAVRKTSDATDKKTTSASNTNSILYFRRNDLVKVDTEFSPLSGITLPPIRR
jgi:hypothetical protein